MLGKISSFSSYLIHGQSYGIPLLCDFSMLIVGIMPSMAHAINMGCIGSEK